MRALGVTDAEMSDQEQAHPRNLREQIYGCFQTWAIKQQGRASRMLIIKALRDPAVERMDLAHNVQSLPCVK